MRVILLLLLSFGTCSVADADWSFEDHPAVGYFDFTDAEEQIFRDKTKDIDADTLCEMQTDAHIAVYVHRYPRFALLADKPVWRQRWIDAFALTSEDGLLTCNVLDLYEIALRSYARSATSKEAAYPFYCGRFTDRQLPAEVEAAVRALVALAFEQEVSGAAISLLAEQPERGAPVKLNTDIG